MASTDSSISSDQDDLTIEEKNIQLFCKSMLQGRLFIGTFEEKRYVASLNAYRDIISINKEEKELLHDLDVVQKKIRGYTNKWLGITSPEIIGAPVGYCLWVELSREVFGSYWYQIKGIKFRKNEVIVRIKQVRAVSPVADLPELKQNKCTPKRQVVDSNSTAETGYNFKETLQIIKDDCISTCAYLFSNVLTLKNTKDAIIFLSVLVMTLFTGAIQLIEYLGDFFLRLLRELSFFLKSASPIIIACINMIGKSIMGLYLLIAMLWRDRKTPMTVYKPYEKRPLRLNYGEYPDYAYAAARGLPDPRQRYRTSGVKITPLDD